MPYVEGNGIRLYYENTGAQGDPIVLVHGSWVDHHTWDLLVPRLAESFQVLTYDRRGHSASGPATTKGTTLDDADDLATLLEATDLFPAHVVANSLGGAVALHLAERRPDLLRSLMVHEAPIYRVIDRDPQWMEVIGPVVERANQTARWVLRGDPEAAARAFLTDVAGLPEAWDRMRPELRQAFVANAPTWLEESADPTAVAIDAPTLAEFLGPALLTTGRSSPAWLAGVADRLAEILPNARRLELPETGHVPHLTDPDMYLGVIVSFCLERSVPVS